MSYTGSKAQPGRGTIVSIGATPNVIGEVADFPLNRGKWQFVDTTNFQSGSDSEKLATIREAATMTLKGNRVPSDAGQVAVETAYQAGSLQPFTVELPKTAGQSTKGDTYTFNAYVVSYDFTIAPTKQIEFSIDLQASGPVTVTPGT